MNPSQQNNTDMTANFFWLLIIIAVFLIALWWFGHKEIVRGLFFLRHIELAPVVWVGKGWNATANYLHHSFSWISLPTMPVPQLQRLQHFLIHADDKHINFRTIEIVSHYVGLWYRYPVIIILLAMATFMFFHHRSARFNHSYSMKTLKKAELANWPQIMPVADLDLVKQDLNEGAWAMSQLPIDFCRQHDLLHVTELHGKRVWGLDTHSAEHLFVLQLGSPWQGVLALPIYMQALVIIFVAKAMRQHDVANKLIDQIAASAEHGQLDFTGVAELISEYKDSNAIKWLEKRHAYINTLMPSLLEIARSDGVIATAEFIWLKPLDRRLWYILNMVGRQTSVVEVAGTYAHWKAEKKLSRSLRIPMVKQAVIALEQSVNNILYVEEVPWHTNNAA